MNVSKLSVWLLAAAMLAACGKQDAPAEAAEPVASVESAYAGAADDADHAPDWEGTYQGALPCADCSEVLTTLELKRDMSYRYTAEYKGGKQALKIEEQGKFEWDDGGSVAELDLKDHEDLRFVVADGYVQQLADGESEAQEKPEYQLRKQ